jgi:hypothetical protein
MEDQVAEPATVVPSQVDPVLLVKVMLVVLL